MNLRTIEIERAPTQDELRLIRASLREVCRDLGARFEIGKIVIYTTDREKPTNAKDLARRASEAVERVWDCARKSVLPQPTKRIRIRNYPVDTTGKMPGTVGSEKLPVLLPSLHDMVAKLMSEDKARLNEASALQPKPSVQLELFPKKRNRNGWDLRKSTPAQLLVQAIDRILKTGPKTKDEILTALVSEAIPILNGDLEHEVSRVLSNRPNRYSRTESLPIFALAPHVQVDP